MKFRDYLKDSLAEDVSNQNDNNIETVKPKDKDELSKIIKETIEQKGNDCDLNLALL